MRPEVTAILGVLRHAAIAGRGVLNISDVDALDEVVEERAALLEALKGLLSYVTPTVEALDTGTPSVNEIIRRSCDAARAAITLAGRV